MQEAAGTQSGMTYIGRLQATGAQGVVLRPIFVVCASETVYEEGGGCRREAWWRQGASDNQLWSNLEDRMPVFHRHIAY